MLAALCFVCATCHHFIVHNSSLHRKLPPSHKLDLYSNVQMCPPRSPKILLFSTALPHVQLHPGVFTNSPYDSFTNSLNTSPCHHVIVSGVPTRITHRHTRTPFLYVPDLHSASLTVPSTRCPHIILSHLTRNSTMHPIANPPHRLAEHSLCGPTHVLPDPHPLNCSPFALHLAACMHLCGTC